METLLDRPLRRFGPANARTREIARVLGGHGLESLADLAGLRRFVPRIRGDMPPLTQAERLRLALGELGTTFMKLGQTLSTRADLLPAPFVSELAKLQDAAPTIPFSDVRRTLEEELDTLGAQPFLAIDPVPIAAASIGQVHGAILLDGTSVVVKVRRPGVVKQVELDLEILRGIVEWMQDHTAIGRDYDIRGLADEFAYTLRQELDYRREADNARRLARLFEGDEGVRIPHVYDDFTTSRLLTMERVGGIKITDLAELDRRGIARRAVAENAVRLFLRELLEFGFFHADPHPGNFFVQEDGSLAIVDFGMVGQVNETTKRHLLRAVAAASEQDSEELAEALYALGVAGKRARREPFQRDLDHLIASLSGRSIREVSAASVIDEIARVALRHKLQLPPGLALLLRVINMSEGIGLTLDPDFHYLEYAGPLMMATWKQQNSLGAVAQRAGRAAADTVELSLDLPRRMSHLIARMERGEIPLHVTHHGIEGLTRDLQRMTNRLALAILLAASVVALGVAVGVRNAPGLEPLVLWLFRLALLFSLVFGASVLWGIWRSGRR